MPERICPNCGQPYPPDWDEADIIAIVPPVAEASCDVDGPSLIVWSGTPPVEVDDEVLEEQISDGSHH